MHTLENDWIPHLPRKFCPSRSLHHQKLNELTISSKIFKSSHPGSLDGGFLK